MYIKDYVYITPTIDCIDHKEIDGINRDDIAVNQFTKKISDRIPELTASTAILYSAGFSISQSESHGYINIPSRNEGTVPLQKTTRVLNESSINSLHKWIGQLEGKDNIVHTSINSNTCASSMYAIYEAERLLKENICEEVLIIAEERTSYNTLRIFKEHRIPIVCGDALAIVLLSKDDYSKGMLTNSKWKYQYNTNPFKTTIEGYRSVIPSVNIDYVKLHGTRTPDNDAAESELVKLAKPIYYKDTIGHTQGASALIEVCMLLDDDRYIGNILCVASGLGGFYGSCVLTK